MRQPSVVELADRLQRRHVGAVLGTLDLASDRMEITGRGRVGIPDGTRPGPDTLFEIGSITKTFTSLALAVLVGSGTVSLRTPLRDLLPTGAAVPSRDGTEITLEHLARHTSGLPRTPNPLLREIRAVLRGENPYDMDEAAALDSLRRVSLRHTPGQGHGGYSNLGGGLLGIALRRAAGARDYEEMLRATVLQPLQLSDTVIRPTADQIGAARPRPRLSTPAGRTVVPGGAGWSRGAPVHGGGCPPLPASSARARQYGAGEGDPAHPSAVGATPKGDHRPGVDPDQAARWRPVVAQRRHRRIP